MAKLTKTYITQLPPPEAGQRIIWDDEQGGLGIRVTKGSKSFVFQARQRGQSIRMTLGGWPDWSVDMARERARELAVKIDKGIDPREEGRKQEAEGVTLETIFTKFMDERELKDRTRYDYQRYLDKHLADWKAKPVKSIGADMVMKRYKDIAASKSGAAQASSVMRMMRSVLNYAKAEMGADVLTNNPVATLTAKKAWLRDNARTDHLRNHEIKPFIEAVRGLDNPVMAAYIEFILLTGARRGEAATLRWRDVDVKARTVTFKDTKNHDDRVLPITPRVAELLEQMRAIRMGEYVFATMGKDGKPTHITEPRKAMMSANKQAGSAVTVHGLRRTYATVLEGLDCPMYPLKTLLGHSTKGDVTTAHYTQITVERLRPWAEKYEAYMLALIGDAKGGEVVPLCKQAVERKEA